MYRQHAKVACLISEKHAILAYIYFDFFNFLPLSAEKNDSFYEIQGGCDLAATAPNATIIHLHDFCIEKGATVFDCSAWLFCFIRAIGFCSGASFPHRKTIHILQSLRLFGT